MKGYESTIWMVPSLALQAAGHEDLFCRQQDMWFTMANFKVRGVIAERDHHCRPKRFQFAEVFVVRRA